MYRSFKTAPDGTSKAGTTVTMCPTASSHPTFTTLPTELSLQIMTCLPTILSLHSLLTASPTHRQIYRAHKTTVLTAIRANYDTILGVLPELTTSNVSKVLEVPSDYFSLMRWLIGEETFDSTVGGQTDLLAFLARDRSASSRGAGAARA